MKLILTFILIIPFIIILSLLKTRKDNSKIKYRDRDGNDLIEKTPGEFWLKWLYRSRTGQLFLHNLIKRKFISIYYGYLMNKDNSKNRIKDFISEFDIDMNQFEDVEYNSFNEFFCRKLKTGARDIDKDENSVVSPADGKIIVIQNIDESSPYFVKGDKYSLKKHFNGNFDYKKYIGGSVAIIRLAPSDYHRFHFPVNGKVSENINITGDYFSVSPIAVIENISYFFKNKRTLTEIKTEEFGDVIYSDIGATMVGSIFQTFIENSNVVKGDEKGYFKFGGSSIILFFEKNKITFSKSILKNSNEGFETAIKMGEFIAYKKQSHF